MKKPITIKDLAKQLGISVATVSRALRNYDDISAETKKAVRDLAKKLDYQPNTIAQSLVNKKSNHIGIVIPGLIVHFYASAISGIQQVAREQGFNVVISQSNESYEMEMANINTLMASRIDGLIVSLSSKTTRYDHLKKLQSLGIPVVMINRVTDLLKVDKVIIDDYMGAFQAVSHLIYEGATQVAFIGGPDSLSTSQQRLKGYRDALNYNHLPLNEDLIQTSDLSKKQGYEITHRLLEQDQIPDGIFTVNDTTAFGAIKAIQEKGLQIPQDIGLVSYGNDPLAELIDPPLTSIAQPTFELGKISAELLFARIKNLQQEQDVQTRILSPELIIRKSSQKSIYLPLT
ncbi:MAG: LacI family DNA-binding transcriptional regulator [Candidatus Cyclobacteriaceae bacterium M3_2C_046]